MRKLFVLALLIPFFAFLLGQDAQFLKLYDPNSNALRQISEAVGKANAENKHVLIQVGGNWCPWCIKLHNFIEEHDQIDSIVKADYVFILVNYSKDNKNPEAMALLDYPQRFGFPVLVILDGEGKRLHTQNTLYLEEDEYYNEKRLKDFLLDWNTAAVDPEKYH